MIFTHVMGVFRPWNDGWNILHAESRQLIDQDTWFDQSI